MSSTDSNTSNLTAYDWKVYNIKKERMFKGTIAVCIIYGVIAATLMVCSYLFSQVRDMLFVQFLPFTVVYIIGTIIIIVALILYILTFKVSKVNIYPEYPDVSCPDYWDMEILNESSSNLFDKSLNKDLFKYRCVLNSNLFNNIDIATMSANSSTPFSISDSYNITGNKDIVNGDKARQLAAGNNIDDNKYRHIYKNINDSKSSLNSEVYSNLLNSALIMNNYEYDKKNDIYSNLQSLTSNQAIPPISWKYDSSEPIIPFSGGNSTFYSSIVKNWNGITFNTLKTAYGNNLIGVYLRNNSTAGKRGTQVGTIVLDDDTSNIQYSTNTNIILDAVASRTTAITSPINKAVLDVITVPQTPAQKKAQEKALKDKADALKKQLDNFRKSTETSLQNAISDNANVNSAINIPKDIDLTTCFNGDMSNGNSDSLGIPPPYIELIPVGKKDKLLPNNSLKLPFDLMLIVAMLYFKLLVCTTLLKLIFK